MLHISIPKPKNILSKLYEATHIKYGKSSAPNLFSSGLKTGLAGIPGALKPNDFINIANERVQVAKSSMQRVLTLTDPVEMIKTIDDVSNDLCIIADGAELIRNVHPNPHDGWGLATEESVGIVSEFMSSVNIDDTTYHHVKSVYESAISKGENNPLSKEQSSVLNSMLTAMEFEGVHLSPVEKEQVLKLQSEEMMLTQQLTTTLSSGNAEDHIGIRTQFGMPLEKLVKLANEPSIFNKNSLRAYTEENESIFISQSSYLASLILKYAKDEGFRKECWEMMQIENPSRKRQLIRLRDVRDELSRIRGYSSFVKYAQRESILNVKDSEDPSVFLNRLFTSVRPHLDKDLSKLSKLRSDIGHRIGDQFIKESTGLKTFDISPWDMDFYQTKYKDLYFQNFSNHLSNKSVFTLSRILEGCSTMLDKLFNIDFKVDRNCRDQIWDWDVSKFDLISKENSKLIGSVFIDPYCRVHKHVDSAQFTLRGSKILRDGSRQPPIGALVLSLPPQTNLMSYMGAVTFLHEFGHICHTLLSETELQHFSGARGSVDYVEFVSHLFEYFIYDFNHAQIFTNELTENWRSDFMKNRFLFGNLEIANQVGQAFTDLDFYSTDEKYNFNTVCGEYSEYLTKTPVTNFDHIIHYGGNYYCYLLSRCLSSAVFHHTLGKGQEIFDRSAGQRYYDFMKDGSVDQRLQKILEIVPNCTYNTRQVPVEYLIKDINGQE